MSKILDRAREVFDTEIEGLNYLKSNLNGSFEQLVAKCMETLDRGGKLVFSGVGKSGYIAKKIAATLSSVGSPSIFMHPVEAMHGDLGVLSGLEVIRTLQEAGFRPSRPIVVVAFTNEEGVRYQPDMMGSLVYAGGQPLDEALDSIGTDGTRLGDELARIGYAGTINPGDIVPSTFVELHIEQGPILDVEGTQIGVVESLQGIHWKRVTFHGAQNHAGTTPTSMRRDAGLAAAKVNVRMREEALANSKFLCTVGTIALEPNAVNVIPDKATFTVDLRSPQKDLLDSEDAALEEYLRAVAEEDGLTVESEQLTCFDPVPFDEGVCQRIEASCQARGFSHRRITSGAGQDAQMMARICPTAMIFVPSVNGISHNPKEFSRDEDCVNGANVLLDVLSSLAE